MRAAGRGASPTTVGAPEAAVAQVEHVEIDARDDGRSRSTMLRACVAAATAAAAFAAASAAASTRRRSASTAAAVAAA